MLYIYIYSYIYTFLIGYSLLAITFGYSYCLVRGEQDPRDLKHPALSSSLLLEELEAEALPEYMMPAPNFR